MDNGLVRILLHKSFGREAFFVWQKMSSRIICLDELLQMNLINKSIFMLRWIIHWFLMIYVSFSWNVFIIKRDILGKSCQISSQIPSFTRKSNDVQTSWKPLVIIIPLRLGLNDVNAEYVEQIKVCRSISSYWILKSMKF